MSIRRTLPSQRLRMPSNCGVCLHAAPFRYQWPLSARRIRLSESRLNKTDDDAPHDEPPNLERLAHPLDPLADLVLVLDRPVAVPHRAPLAPELALLRRRAPRQREGHPARDVQQREEELPPDAVHVVDRVGGVQRVEVLGRDPAVDERRRGMEERVRGRRRGGVRGVAEEAAVGGAARGRGQDGRGEVVRDGRDEVWDARRDGVVGAELGADPARREGLATVALAAEGPAAGVSDCVSDVMQLRRDKGSVDARDVLLCDVSPVTQRLHDVVVPEQRHQRAASLLCL